MALAKTILSEERRNSEKSRRRLLPPTMVTDQSLLYLFSGSIVGSFSEVRSSKFEKQPSEELN